MKRFFNRQWGIGNGQYATSNGKYAMSNGKYAMSNGKYAIGNGQYAMSNGKYAMSNGKYAIGNGKYATSNGKYAMSNGQYAMDNMQWEMGNMQWEMGKKRGANFFTYCKFLISNCLSLIANCLLLIVNYLLLIAYHLSLIAYYKLLIANRKLLIANCLLLIANYSYAQTSITLQQAIDTALVNNLSVKNEKLRTEYHQKLIKSGTAIPATNIGGQYGQINSFYPDLSLGISQTLSFPTVYSRQKDLLTEEWKSSVLNLKIKETELKKLVTEVYFNLLYIQQKKKLLLENDSLFSEFLSKSILRFQKGESNILEKTTAENQRGQIALQLSQLEQDWEILQLQFQYLLNTTTVFVPDESEILFQNISSLENAEFIAHPLVQYWKQQQNIAVANTKVEKSKLLPDITLGYNIMGMKGMGANDVEYNSNLRFHSVQIGLGIPIFNSSQKSKINASKINEQIAVNDYEVNLRNLETTFTQAMKQYQKYQDAVLYFENTALKNAETLKTTANKQFLNGEINYLEWVLLMNQAINIQSDYIEAVRNRNNAVTEINYYQNK